MESSEHPPETPPTRPLQEVYANGRFGLSFELFPPKTPRGEEVLWDHVARLCEFSPDLITCTYGAGGSTREKTMGVIEQVKLRHQVPVATHLTCVGATIDQLREYLEQALRRGVDYVVALRGDPPQGDTSFQAVPGGLSYANELVELIRAEFPQFGIAVAAYPEVHQEAVNAQTDLDNLKRKIDAGGDVAVTQLFYDNDDFFRFRDRYEQAGIQAPLVPGLLPVTNLSQVTRITSLCGSRLPEQFTERLGEKADDTQWQFNVGVEHASAQAQGLIAGGAAGLHFYVLNRSEATTHVLKQVALPGR